MGDTAMNRRGFLKSLFAAGTVTAAGVALPKVTYFLPPTKGWTPGYSTYTVGKDAYFVGNLSPELIRIQEELNYRMAITWNTLVALTANNPTDKEIKDFFARPRNLDFSKFTLPSYARAA